SKDRAIELLRRVGLQDRTDHLPDELSGGEQHRVAVARALANHPRIVLADEPTGDLDTQTGFEVVQLMHSMAKQEGSSVVVVTHDPVVAERADRLVEMRDGRITEKVLEPLMGQRRTIRAVEPLPPEPGRSLSQPNSNYQVEESLSAKIASRSLPKRRARTILTIASVFIGVALLVGITMTTASALGHFTNYIK